MATTRTKYHAQPRIIGIRRESTFSALVPAIRAKVVATAFRYNVRPSWVIAEILADAFGVDIPSYKRLKATRGTTRLVARR